MYVFVGICDRCGAEHRVARCESIEAFRESARRAGWRVIEQKDLCSACRTWLEVRGMLDQREQERQSKP
jgi:hypothetical protein